MKSAGKARNNGLYRHIRTSKEIIRNLLNDSVKHFDFVHILLYLVHDESERESATASCETWAVLTNNFKEAAKIIAALLNSKQKR